MSLLGVLVESGGVLRNGWLEQGLDISFCSRDLSRKDL